MTRYTPQWLQAGSYPASVDRRLISAVWPTAAVSGCAVTVAAGTMNVNVAPGWVVVPTANNTGAVLCTSDAVEVVALATAPASGLNRIDVVTCAVASTDIGTAAGDAFTFSVVTGVPGASPAVPAVPAGSVAVAQVLVVGGSASLSAANVTDRRVVANAAATTYGRAWRQFGFTPAGSTVVQLDTANFDPSGAFNPTPGRFTALVAGIYLVTGALSVNSVASGNQLVAVLTKNGVGATNGALASASGPSQILTSAFSDLVQCAVGDVLALFCSWNPANLVGTVGTSYTFLAAQFLHP